MGLNRLKCAARAAGYAMVPPGDHDDADRTGSETVAQVLLAPMNPALPRSTSTALTIAPRVERAPQVRDWLSFWWMGRAVA